MVSLCLNTNTPSHLIMPEGDRKNKQPALESKKGPVASYTKIASAADSLLTASNSFIAKVKTAREGGGMIQPDEVLQLLNEQILPAIQVIQRGIEGGASPVGGQGERSLPGEGTPKPVDAGNEGMGELDGEPEKKIAKLEETVAILTAKDLQTRKAGLAQRYASLFPYGLQLAKEKEITDSKDDYALLEAKVEGAEIVMKAAKDSGEFKRTRVFSGSGSTYGQSRFAKAGDMPIPAWAR